MILETYTQVGVQSKADITWQKRFLAEIRQTIDLNAYFDFLFSEISP